MASRTSWFELSFMETSTPETSEKTRKGGATTEQEMEGHVKGTCDPCVFFASVRGCVKGIQCDFCHQDHPAMNKDAFSRPRKDRRRRMKKTIIEHLSIEDVEEMHTALQSEARRHPYIRMIIPLFLKQTS
ncbi:Uncharacterized protein SCF082_LOCUS14249 [Durusdinium trenchii]|uniref:C3H1-type domain-containing protein n=1 Tax=Durusdinium trenchii TaxID=1381693 RepID=A0ABP0JXV7_9DINO